jgi:hypothetical protein
VNIITEEQAGSMRLLAIYQRIRVSPSSRTKEDRKQGSLGGPREVTPIFGGEDCLGRGYLTGIL